ncbi:MAG: GHMP kinase [Candidatus Lokiarchaeota archaeon]|nr:GHMP kinase [Candidatus Lokiarchaeota archaeon]
MIIRSKAPFRVSFGGGGTDMPPYCVDHGGCVINTTIDRHVFVTIKPREDNFIHINAINFDDKFIFKIGDNDYTVGYEIFKGVVNVLGINNGFNIKIFSELPAGSGMGGSSSLAVALIGAFNEYYNLGYNIHEIAQKAYEIERIELKQKGGYQDQFATSYGGFNFIEFSNKVEVLPINASKDIINELQYCLILCYVGGSHFSSDIQDEVLEGYQIEKKSYMESMEDLKKVAYGMKEIIESDKLNKINDFGELLHQGWLAKKGLSNKISNKKIENFYLTSRRYGVIGGKLLGAGGGGHLLLFSNPKQKFKVIQELEKIGGKIINFHFNPNGLEVWKIKD